MSEASKVTKQTILLVAKQEFLKNGYRDANMRDIAKLADVTTGALYRHFKNKEDLFYEVVKEVYEKTFEFLKAANETSDMKGRIDNYTYEQGILKIRVLLDFMMENKEEYQLLLLYSQGSRLENFIHRLTDMYTEDNLEFIRNAEIAGVVKKVPSKMAVHILTSGFLNELFELVLHDLSTDEVKEYIEAIGHFQYHGWSGLLGIKR